MRNDCVGKSATYYSQIAQSTLGGRASASQSLRTVCNKEGFDFGALYGELGRGYIHVHHLTPVSEIGESYKVYPATELIPVWPNRHAMLQKHKPPILVEELRVILSKGTPGAT